jgi:hypothetical protein
MPIYRLGVVVTLAIAVCSVAAAQQSEADLSETNSPVSASTQSRTTLTSCNPWTFQILPQDLSFWQRSCLQIAQLTSPGLLVTAGFAASYGHWRNISTDRKNSEEYTRRILNYYARRTARASAELLVGYLHHEDPRPRYSGETSGWRRARAALLSVVDSPSPDGNARPALAPIAGAFGSGFTAMGVDLHHNGVDYALIYSGAVYGHYFASALFHEFRPELRSLAPGFIRKHLQP